MDEKSSRHSDNNDNKSCQLEIYMSGLYIPRSVCILNITDLMIDDSKRDPRQYYGPRVY